MNLFNFIYLTIGFLTVYTQAVKYVAQPDDNADFDGVGIGILYRPSVCEKTTVKGDLMRVYFNGTLGDGSPFETGYMSKPFEFVLGEGQVIQGWEAGLQDMCKGEIRYLTVPPKYAWGNAALGSIPSRVNLHFFVELISFHSIDGAPRKPDVFSQIDINHDGILSRDEVKGFLENTGIHELDGEAGLRQMLRDIFQEEDRDKNGYIAHHEFSGRKHVEL